MKIKCEECKDIIEFDKEQKCVLSCKCGNIFIDNECITTQVYYSRKNYKVLKEETNDKNV